MEKYYVVTRTKSGDMVIVERETQVAAENLWVVEKDLEHRPLCIIKGQIIEPDLISMVEGPSFVSSRCYTSRYSFQ